MRTPKNSRTAILNVDAVAWLSDLFGFGEANFDPLTLRDFEFWHFTENEDRASQLHPIKSVGLRLFGHLPGERLVDRFVGI
jgi:hypothetical protein